MLTTLSMPVPTRGQPRRWVAVYEPGTTRIAFRIDARAGIIEIQRQGERRVYDLTEYGMICAAEGLDKHE